jgi:hypothetical protein
MMEIWSSTPHARTPVMPNFALSEKTMMLTW